MFNQMKSIDGYSYYISNDSDDDACRGSDSSEDEKQYDEVDVFLHGTPKQQKKALQRLAGNEASSSEDEFEKMMKEELNDKMALHERSWMQKSAGGDQPSSSNDPSSAAAAATYDDIYFDSDEDNEDNRVRAKKKKLSNDELFYDPFADVRDQRWADKQRRRGSSAGDEKAATNPDDTPVLTCPACLTTLCMDSQRHETYKEQYRAMFVMNCKVLRDEILRHKEPKKKKFKRHRRQEAAAMATAEEAGFTTSTDVVEGSEQVFHPVKCDKCDTEVAVFDQDEIYHFFNVLAGPA